MGPSHLSTILRMSLMLSQGAASSLTPRSLRRRLGRSSRSNLRATMDSIGSRFKTALKSVHAFMTVPMYAALLSIAIAMIPPLQAVLSNAKPFREAVKGAGQCSSAFLN